MQISLRYPSKNNHWATHTALERWHKTAMPETHKETSVQTHMPATTTQHIHTKMAQSATQKQVAINEYQFTKKRLTYGFEK